MKNRSAVTFYLNSRLHEDLKIRLHYDGFNTQSNFFRACVVSYLEKDEKFMKFLDHYKINEKLQSKANIRKSVKLRETGQGLMKKLGIDDEEIENIFDLIEEELPDL